MNNAANVNGVRQTEVSNASNSSMSSNGGGAYVKEGKLPLADDFFKVPSLSAKESKYLVGLAKRACKEVVYYSRKTDGPMKWVHLSSEDGIELCQGVDESAPATTSDTARSLIYLRGATKIYATIDEIADFFRLDTPLKLSLFAQTVGKDVMDQQTLCTLATPTAENPKHYVCAKWTAIESPSKLARNRDFCYLECHDEFIDTNSKKRGWVRSVHSIRLPFCPQLDRSHGLVRGSLYRSGFVFIESNEKGCVDAIHTLHMDVKGNSPNWIKVLAMKRRIKNISQVNKYFQLQRLTQGKLLGDLELPTKAGIVRCQVCENKFGLFNRKRRCRKCGKVMCTSCGHSYIVDYAGAGPKKVRVCVGCSEAVVFGKFDDGSLGNDKEQKINKVKQVDDADFQPIYDPSYVSGDEDGDAVDNRHLSVEEHEYYLENEDQRGISDMLEAKRMQKDFESHMRLSGGPAMRNQKEKLSGRTDESLSGVTLPTDSPPSLWDPEDGVVYEDTLGDDDLGIPRSKQQLVYEEILRQQQQKELRTATQTISHQQPLQRALARASSQRRSSKEEERNRLLNGSLLDQQDQFFQRARHSGKLDGAHERKDSLESIRISSDWGFDYNPSTDLLHHNNNYGGGDSYLSSSSYFSNTGHLEAPVRRSDLSVDPFRDSFVREHSMESSASFHHPQPAANRASSTSADQDKFFHLHQHYDDDDHHRRPSADMAAPHSSHGQVSSTPLSGNGSVLRRNSENSGHESMYSSPLSTSAKYSPHSAPKYHGSSNSLDSEMTRHRQSWTEMSGRDEIAQYMALSAMKLFEMERGPDLQVPDEVRQSALSKMMAVYASEIEQSSSSGAGLMQDRRAFNAQARHGPTPQLMRRSVSEDLRERFRRESPRHGDPRYQRSSMAPLGRSESYELGYLQHKSSPATLQARASGSWYQDLSDMSSRAFQDYQIHSGAMPGHPVDNQPAGQTLLRRNDSFMGRPTAQQAAALRESVSGPRGSLKPDDMARPDLRARLSGTIQGSVTSSDARQPLSRPESIYEDAESDTFSELDFVELPHLMRKDYVAPATTSGISDDRSSSSGDSHIPNSSFTDVHQWQQEEERTTSPLEMGLLARDSIYHEGVERRLSELNPDEHIFHQTHGDFSSESSECRDSLSIASSPTRQNGNLVTEVPSSSSTAFAPEFSHGSSKASRPESHSSYSSDEPDYVTEEAFDQPTGRSQMSLSELERYRASLAELMSDYNVDREYLTDSLSADDQHQRSFGSGFLYNPLAQPEFHHRHLRNGFARRHSVNEEDEVDDDDDAVIRPTQHEGSMLREMYI